MIGDAFRWSMKNPQGEIRFTIRLNEQGEWVELGEMSHDGTIDADCLHATRGRTDWASVFPGVPVGGYWYALECVLHGLSRR